MDHQEKIQSIKALRIGHEKKILAQRGITGVGTGFKIKNAKPTDELCMTVYVEKKESAGNIPTDMLIPSSFQGQDGVEIQTDIIETGRIYAHAFTSRIRPAVAGCSIGHFAITAGTFGAVAIDRLTKDEIILSNNHVLANVNHAHIGDLILQPGPADGGTPNDDTIAKLLRFHPISFPGPNLVDAALAKPLDNALIKQGALCPNIDPVNQNAVGLLFAGSSAITIVNHIKPVLDIMEIDLPKTAAATHNMNVHKCGRTTEYTTGRITDLDGTFNINFGDKGVATFSNQIATTPMSQGGDSGSVVYEMPQTTKATD